MGTRSPLYLTYDLRQRIDLKWLSLSRVVPNVDTVAKCLKLLLLDFIMVAVKAMVWISNSDDNETYFIGPVVKFFTY